MTEKTIEVALAECTSELMGLPGVFGTAQGLQDGQPCIVIFIDEDDPEVRRQLPREIEGYPVLIKKTGKFRTLAPKN